MPALQEPRGGWRINSQACLPSTIPRAPTKKSKMWRDERLALDRREVLRLRCAPAKNAGSKDTRNSAQDDDVCGAGYSLGCQAVEKSVRRKEGGTCLVVA
jgi:hypothetical protein